MRNSLSPIQLVRDRQCSESDGVETWELHVGGAGIHSVVAHVTFDTTPDLAAEYAVRIEECVNACHPLSRPEERVPQILRNRDTFMARNAHATGVLREISELSVADAGLAAAKTLAVLGLAGLPEISGEPLSEVRSLLRQIWHLAGEPDALARENIQSLVDVALRHLCGEA